MASTRPPAPPDAGPNESRLVWFSVLERARGEGDRDAEDEALAELDRLGVRISYGPKRSPKTKVSP